MKNIILSLMVISSLGCQTTSPSIQEQESQIQQESDVDTSDSVSSDQTSNPGEITFKIEILNTFSSEKEICGVAKKNVYEIKVIELIEKGMGITHTPKKSDEFLVHLVFPSADLAIGTQLEAKAKESLCSDASKSYFTVISQKILD